MFRPRFGLCHLMVCCLGLSGWLVAAAFDPLLPPLSPDQVLEVRRTLEAMKQDPRGPYFRIRWFCNDGTVQPPAGTPCREGGGGVQHAEFNDAARHLTELHFHVGTILQAMDFEQFFDSSHNHHRLKELVLETYLIETDDGWVLRRARYYRGARQIEDEERQGERFLENLLQDPDWISRNFLLASLAVSVVPHAGSDQEQLTSRIRNLATEISQLDPRFQDLRSKIHSFPSRDDVSLVDTYLAAPERSPEVREKLLALKVDLTRHYDPVRGDAALRTYRRRLPQISDQLARLIESIERLDPSCFSQMARLSAQLRRQIEETRDGAANLARLDLIHLLEQKAFSLASQHRHRAPTRSRNQQLADLADYFALAFAGGFLSERELEALESELKTLQQQNSLPALDYKRSLSYLAKGLDWARSTARYLFAGTYDRYVQVEPKSSGFLDSLLRASTLLFLSQEIGYLSRDADRFLGQSHTFFGQALSHGMQGLNPGMARAALEITERYDPGWQPDPRKIYVIPDTFSDLRPMAGILTLDAGNLLSHAQLLARTLGIPNAAISPSLLPRLRNLDSQEVFFAVSPMGRVVLDLPARLGESESRLLASLARVQPVRTEVDTSRLMLDRLEPIPLSRLRAGDSGRVVGPKAANLGELHHRFPNRVAPGLALPFGMYYQHINRPYRSDQTLYEEIRKAYRQALEMERKGSSEAEVDLFMFEQLARFRQAVQELEWIPESRTAVVKALQETFGPDLGGGVFIRSDTNVEDLPHFSGAGLNLTVPHQTTVEEILRAIKRVWASPFGERAYLWRKQVFQGQGDVLASVLLLQSVPSEKSGVLITAGLEEGGDRDLTIVTAEGVGGAVEGESAETILVQSSGQVRLLFQSKAPYRRVLSAEGGVRLIPSSGVDYLLTSENIAQLRSVVRQWEAELVPSEEARIWDMEFGFVGDHLWLFQIRPFVAHGNKRAMELLKTLDRDLLNRAQRSVDLEEAME